MDILETYEQLLNDGGRCRYTLKDYADKTLQSFVDRRRWQREEKDGKTYFVRRLLREYEFRICEDSFELDVAGTLWADGSASCEHDGKTQAWAYFTICHMRRALNDIEEVAKLTDDPKEYGRETLRQLIDSHKWEPGEVSESEPWPEEGTPYYVRPLRDKDYTVRIFPVNDDQFEADVLGPNIPNGYRGRPGSRIDVMLEAWALFTTRYTRRALDIGEKKQAKQTMGL